MNTFFKKENTSAFLTLKDYSVSGEEFNLLYHEKYDMLITSPQPEGKGLEKYYQSEDYISHTDSKKTFFDKAYQRIKNLMLKKKLNWIEKEYATKGKLLDIGAGTGDFLLAAKNAGWDVSGVEPNLKARNLSAEKGIPLDVETGDFQKESFDVITMWHVLEHVPNLESQIVELKRLLKKDGLLIIAVPNFKSYDAQHYKKFWAAYDVPRHLWHFSQTAISSLFQNQKMAVRKTLPLKFDAYYVSLLSEKYKNKKANPVSALKTALTSNLKAKRTGEYSSLAYFIRNN